MSVRKLLVLGLSLYALTAIALEWPYKTRPSQGTALLGVPGNIIEVPVASPGEVFVPPNIINIPEDKHGDMIKLGRNIFVETRKYAGRYAGNGLNCSSCHLSEGRKADAAPLWGAYGMYPTYRGKNEQVNTFEMRIQDCFRFSLDGLSPPLDSPEMQAIVAYAQWLATGAPARVALPGRGFTNVRRDIEPSGDRGKVVYETQCSICHGIDGQGVKNADGDGYQFPPVWGGDSFNRGAGMYTVRTSAAYLKGNMPLGKAFSLTDQEAYDVALYMRLQDHPTDPRIGWLSDFMRTFAGW